MDLLCRSVDFGCRGSTLSFPTLPPLPFRCRWGHCRVLGAVVIFQGLSGAHAMDPVTTADLARASQRALRLVLPEGRPTLDRTSRLRERYWEQFLAWLVSEGIDFDSLLADHSHYIDEINSVMTAFGRALYRAGRPYNQYAEAINHLTSKKPVLRRWMQGSWDLAVQWMQAEPTAHHVAMPWQVLLAMTTVSLTWGWLPLAGALCLMWGALLRPDDVSQCIKARPAITSRCGANHKVWHPGYQRAQDPSHR